MGKQPMEFKGGKTRQSEKDKCDFNKIIARWKETGELPLRNLMKQPQYGDFSSVPKFQESLNIVNVANTQFNKLDVQIRKMFHYSVENFLEFVADPSNDEKCYEMGLKKRPEEPKVKGSSKKEEKEEPEKEIKKESKEENNAKREA